VRYLLFAALFTLLSGNISAQAAKVEFATLQLSDTIYMIRGRGGNLGISSGGDGLYIIDDQVSQVTGPLLDEIRKISNRPIKFIINTHYHSDHTGGNEVFGERGALIVAHDNIRTRMSTEQVSVFRNTTYAPFPDIALPVITFNDRISLHFNGETATAYYVANGHTDGDSIIHFPVSNVIHMGDMYFNKMYPYVDLEAGGAIQGIVEAADLALSMADASTRIIPGHGPLATRDELVAYRDYIVEAIGNVQALIDQSMTLTQVIDAKPTAKWDEELGGVWITPPQFTTFLYNSLMNIHEYTPPVSDETSE